MHAKLLMVIYQPVVAILCPDLLLEVVRRQLLEMIVLDLDLVESTQELALESTQQNPLKVLVELELFQLNRIPESPEVNLIFLWQFPLVVCALSTNYQYRFCWNISSTIYIFYKLSIYLYWLNWTVKCKRILKLRFHQHKHNFGRTIWIGLHVIFPSDIFLKVFNIQLNEMYCFL